jgi:cysteine synthase B
MMGTGKYLKEILPDVNLVAVQPEGPLHGLEGLKHMSSSPHPGIYNPKLPDMQVDVSTEAAYEVSRRLAREEGLLVGVSAGAAVSAALELGRQIEKGLIVVILPDSANKYLDLGYWKSEE